MFFSVTNLSAGRRIKASLSEYSKEEEEEEEFIAGEGTTRYLI